MARKVRGEGGMTAPRHVVAGSTYLVTRRCSQRQFLLRPAKATTQVVGYLLAVAAERYSVEVHAYCVMSNHVHLVVSDPEARLPAFSQFFDSLVARAMNSLLGRWEHFWAPSSYSAVALEGPREVIDKVAYVLANPVAAGLVKQGRQWPGLWSGPAQMGGEAQEYQRPARFFRTTGATALPEEARLGLKVPAGFTSREQFQRAVREALEGREASAAVELAAGGRGFLGARRVLAQSPLGRPAAPEPRRGLNPRVACRDKWRRIQALGRLVGFLEAYRRALQAWRGGAREVLFPAGTYLMRVVHGAACAAPG
jgi:REP element-mobilizing transposase RayT